MTAGAAGGEVGAAGRGADAGAKLMGSRAGATVGGAAGLEWREGETSSGLAGTPAKTEPRFWASKGLLISSGTSTFR